MATIWSLQDLVKIARQRQENELDCNLVFSGNRGTGKSWSIYKFFIFYNKSNPRVKFNPFIHITYSRKKLMRLLEAQRYGVIFDDEAIRSAYKRNFQDADQKLLIQMLNMYRDNFNIYAMAVPKFFSLDKDLRDLIKIHVHVIRRGFGVVHIAKDNTLYSADVWDVGHNKKIEEKFIQTNNKNPTYTPPYHKMTTFAGYIHLPPLTKKQEKLYKALKRVIRKKVYEEEMKEGKDKKKQEKKITEADKRKMELQRHKDEANKMYQQIIQGKLNNHTFNMLLEHNNLKRSTVMRNINRQLADNNSPHTLKTYLKENDKLLSSITPSGRIQRTTLKERPKV